MDFYLGREIWVNNWDFKSSCWTPGAGSVSKGYMAVAFSGFSELWLGLALSLGQQRGTNTSNTKIGGCGCSGCHHHFHHWKWERRSSCGKLMLHMCWASRKVCSCEEHENMKHLEISVLATVSWHIRNNKKKGHLPAEASFQASCSANHSGTGTWPRVC